MCGFPDGRWKVAVRQLIIPAASFFRPRTVTDVVIVQSPQCSTAVLNLPALLAVAPVSAGATIFTSIYNPPILAFFDFNLYTLHNFDFSLTSSAGTPILFNAASPPWYLTIVIASEL